MRDINCVNCAYFDKINIKCSISVGSPIRKCVIAINKNLVKDIGEKDGNFNLLEIGCGTWSHFRDNLPLNLRWEGIDVEKNNYKGEKTIATRMGSVENIPFDREEFDYILANQSIEHWFEYGVTFKKALAEISRVLKKGGLLMFNAPIHFHGHKFFLRGDEDKILKLLDDKYWNIKKIERWRKDPKPLDVYRGWKKNPFSDCLEKKYDYKTSYIINITVQKKETEKIDFWNNIKFYIYKFIFYLVPHKKILILLNYGFYSSLRILKNRKLYDKYQIMRE